MDSKTTEEIVRDSYGEYIKSLMELRTAVDQLRIQTKHTDRAMEKLLKSTHLNAMLSLTRQEGFLNKIGQ